MKTVEQLNELSNIELNKSVAVKMGMSIDCVTCSDDAIYAEMDPKGWNVEFNPCIDPRDYMPIAIKHGIDIEFWKGYKQVMCHFVSDGEGKMTERYPEAQTGRAVCIAFLLMEIDK